ncbi:MAG TPA: 2-amino-4-hydroxy-6-hydroxymethyldihydropteridine diphosphokinase [Steroidobacteraceae bacterium]|nr:2-amino-4-hydroxy-6-hydroxymethyldihydropteridine diphosphokinase [Steroidobacteraceae bacterium]
MTLAYVSGGSNLEPEKNLVIAALALKVRHPGARFSRCYRNRAVGFEGPDFINFVVELPVAGNPALLKCELECVETQCGRHRDAPKWAPRAMDLDILLFGEVVQHTPGLVLPRPDLLRWGFMLGPLAELAPQLLHPVARKTIGELWNEFDRAANPLQPVELDLDAA